jgi:hypothetical protein
MEETVKPRYPKDLDIGRIVIAEIPEEKEVTKRNVVKRDEVKPRREDMETRYEVEKNARKQVQEDVVNVGRLDITDYEKTARQSEVEARSTYTERLGKYQKVA